LMRQRLFYTETGPFATPKFRYVRVKIPL